MGYASRTAELMSLRVTGVCACVCVCRGMVCVVRGSRVSSLLRKEVHRRLSSHKLRPPYFFRFCNSSSIKSP